MRYTMPGVFLDADQDTSRGRNGMDDKHRPAPAFDSVREMANRNLPEASWSAYQLATIMLRARLPNVHEV